MATYDPNVKVQYRIKVGTKFGEFNDALYFTKAEYEALSDAVVQAQVLQRVTNWVKLVEDQSKLVPVEPTTQELQAQKAELQAQIDAINIKLGN